MIKYVGFDKDGTLIDDFMPYADEWGKIIEAQFNIPSKDATKVFIDLAGVATVTQLSTLLNKHNIKLPYDETFKKAEEIAHHLGENVKANPFPDVIPALKKLKEQGLRMFVSSGQREDITKDDLERTGIINYVDYFVGIRPKQPEFMKGEAHFKDIAMHFGIGFEQFIKEAVFIGDTLVDVRIAKKISILSIARIGTLSKEKLLEANADFIINDFSTLSDILRSYSS